MTDTTLGDRIDACLATKALFKLPEDNPEYIAATNRYPAESYDLQMLMEFEGITEARTKTAIAIIDSGGLIWVKPMELPL